MATKVYNALGRTVSFDESMMHVELMDGRRISVPLEWFPKLRQASFESRNRWRWIGGGLGIHWEELDEDISIEGLLGS